jgi:hypothetical protein
MIDLFDVDAAFTQLQRNVAELIAPRPDGTFPEPNLGPTGTISLTIRLRRARGTP